MWKECANLIWGLWEDGGSQAEVCRFLSRPGTRTEKSQFTVNCLQYPGMIVLRSTVDHAISYFFSLPSLPTAVDRRRSHKGKCHCYSRRGQLASFSPALSLSLLVFDVCPILQERSTQRGEGGYHFARFSSNLEEPTDLSAGPGAKKIIVYRLHSLWDSFSGSL